MSELDEKLNALLSDPDSMAQVMHLAQQLSGTLGGENPPPSDSAPPPAQDGIDPQLLGRLMGLLQKSNTASQTTQLLHALQPFLKEEKQGKVERAAKLAHIITLGKEFLSDWEV